MAKNQAAAPAAKLQTYNLPDGAVIQLKRPTNSIRRVLLEQPETNLRMLVELMAAACIVKMVLPAGYADNEQDLEEVFGDELGKPDEIWTRLDRLSLVDNQSLVEAFQTLNLPSTKMIEDVVAAVKSGKKA